MCIGSNDLRRRSNKSPSGKIGFGREMRNSRRFSRPRSAHCHCGKDGYSPSVRMVVVDRTNLRRKNSCSRGRCKTAGVQPSEINTLPVWEICILFIGWNGLRRRSNKSPSENIMFEKEMRNSRRFNPLDARGRVSPHKKQDRKPDSAVERRSRPRSAHCQCGKD